MKHLNITFISRQQKNGVSISLKYLEKQTELSIITPLYTSKHFELLIKLAKSQWEHLHENGYILKCHFGHVFHFVSICSAYLGII